MLRIGDELSESVGDCVARESAEVHERYRDVVSKLMFTMLTEVMNPIYAEHPDIKPPELK